ncbi:MAG: hypothetical protein ACI4MQ_07585 [Candidatus Coproplasma sp.]
MIKYQEEKYAIENYNEGIKERERRAKEEERRTRELEQRHKSTSKPKTSNPEKYIHLQFHGKQPAIKASELKAGDVTVWNGGATEKVVSVKPSKTGKTLDVEIEYTNMMGKKVRSNRRMSVNRLVGIDRTTKPTPAAPAKNKPTSPKTTSKPSEGKSYTVRQGRTCKTFATKAEAKAYKEQCKNKNVTITEGTKKPTHRVVKFTARK